MALIGSLIFFVISFVFFSFLTWDYPLLSPDEPRYAETAREMLENSNFIIPYLDGIPRLVKPVLFYWLDAFSLKIFGINEFAARLPSLISGSGFVALSYLFGSLSSIGALSAIITMTCLGIFLAAKLAITDMLLSFCITAALVFFYLGFDQTSYKRGYNHQGFSIWIFLSIVMMGLGFLTKGPIAFLLPGLIIFIFVFFKSDLISFIKAFLLELGLGLFAALIINLPWYVLVHIATNGEFTSQFFFADNIGRFLSTKTAHSGPIWFYIPVILACLFPWSFFLLQSLFSGSFSDSLSLKSEKSKQEKIFFFAATWSLVVFIFFSISKTKLPTYILPIIMPLCFFIANWWKQRFSVTKSHSSRNFSLLWGLLAFTATVTVTFLIYIFKLKDMLSTIEANSFLLAVILVCSIYLACSAIALTSVFSNAKISFVFFTVANFICLLIFTGMMLKPFAIHRDGGSKAFVQGLSKDAQFKTILCHPSRFSFYRQSIVSELKPKRIKEYFTNNPNAYLVLKTKDYTRLEKRAQRDGVTYENLESNRVFSYIKNVITRSETTKQSKL